MIQPCTATRVRTFNKPFDNRHASVAVMNNPPVLPPEKRGEPWFEDGNILLVTEDSRTAFRVHKGVLARHSEIFRDMFQFSTSTSDTELYDGSPIIYLQDKSSELSSLVKALYDGVSFDNRTVNGFFDLAGILRLSTKYFIKNLRIQAILHLNKTWSNTLQGHDEMVKTALESPSIGDISTYPYNHPLHVLNLAREVNIAMVLPSVFYFLSIYPLVDILRGDHPKLTINHPSKPLSTLTPSDLQLYTVMFQHRLQLLYDFIRFCNGRQASSTCVTAAVCEKGFSRIAFQVSRSWSLKSGPLYFMMQVEEEVSRARMICRTCCTIFRQDVDLLREKIWNELPSVINLPSWEELETNDLRC